MKRVRVLKTEIDCLKERQLKEVVKTILGGKNQRTIGKLNTEFLLRALRGEEFSRVLNACDYNIADGKGVLWAARYLSLPTTKIPILSQFQGLWQMAYSGASLIFYPGFCRNPISQNIPGLDAMYYMLEAADETDSSVYFFGAEKEALEKAVEKIGLKYPSLKIAGYHDGYHYIDEEIIRDINQSEAKLLIVAMGSPKQEYWIRDNLTKLKSVRLAVGEGGSLDRVASPTKKSPRLLQRLSLEWMWRLFTDVNRTGAPGKRSTSRVGRVWQAVPVFIYQVVKWKLSGQAEEL